MMLEVSTTGLPASAVPEMVGAVALVMSSSSVPLSLPASRSRAVGAAGGSESIVTARAAEAALVLPAVSVAVAVRS